MSNLQDLWNSIEDPDFTASENQLNPAPKPFTILSGADLRNVTVPPRVDVLGEGIIALGQMTTIIGQGGTGKSRAAMQTGISQILGWSFAGLKTHPQPLKHLFIGTENSIHRQKSDYLKMTAALTLEKQALVDAHIFFHIVREVDDAFINLGSDDIRKKWLDTIEATAPDCIWVDPFGEVNAGDINKDADVRHTLRELTKVCRRFNQQTAIIIIHHGRTGRQNIAQAVGWDKGNFALGSKALYSGARSQINIAPADPDDHSRIVVSCGKSNDAKPFDPVGLKLNEDTMLYDIDSTFDLNAWKDDVEGKQTGQSASIKDIVEAIQSGNTTHTAICSYVADASGCSSRTVKRRISDSVEKGYVRKGSKGQYHVTEKSTNL